MQLRKWNYEAGTYEPFEVPDNRKVSLYADDINVTIQCACCGRVMKFADGYTSRTIHTAVGFGYIVCEQCFEREAEEIVRCKRWAAE